MDEMRASHKNLVKVARFIRLPVGYYVMSSTEPVVTLLTTGLKNCSVMATVEELSSGNVTHYSFGQSSNGVCAIYSSFDTTDTAKGMHFPSASDMNV